MEKVIEVARWSAWLVSSCLAVQAGAWLLAFACRERRTQALEAQYAAAQSYREDVLHHYYRAREDNEQTTLEALRPRVVRATKDLQAVQVEYEKASNRKTKAA